MSAVAVQSLAMWQQNHQCCGSATARGVAVQPPVVWQYKPAYLPAPQGVPRLDQAGLLMSHGASLCQLCQTPAHQEHCLQAAQPPVPPTVRQHCVWQCLAASLLLLSLAHTEYVGKHLQTLTMKWAPNAQLHTVPCLHQPVGCHKHTVTGTDC